ncbi:MAG: hypothetical protein OEV59_07515 [Deltaproteobacteria bacterium]|nr:hypothetical protein [Deltaproteobacteria bacterium]
MDGDKKTLTESLKLLADVERCAAEIYSHFAAVLKGQDESRLWRELAAEEVTHAEFFERQIELLKDGHGAFMLTGTTQKELDRLLNQVQGLKQAATKPGITMTLAISIAYTLETTVAEGGVLKGLGVTAPELKNSFNAILIDTEKHTQRITGLMRNHVKQKAGQS